jgi:hypothetical protein
VFRKKAAEIQSKIELISPIIDNPQNITAFKNFFLLSKHLLLMSRSFNEFPLTFSPANVEEIEEAIVQARDVEVPLQDEKMKETAIEAQKVYEEFMTEWKALASVTIQTIEDIAPIEKPVLIPNKTTVAFQNPGTINLQPIEIKPTDPKLQSFERSSSNFRVLPIISHTRSFKKLQPVLAHQHLESLRQSQLAQCPSTMALNTTTISEPNSDQKDVAASLDNSAAALQNTIGTSKRAWNVNFFCIVM